MITYYRYKLKRGRADGCKIFYYLHSIYSQDESLIMLIPHWQDISENAIK
jgi:hypothetical protein